MLINDAQREMRGAFLSGVPGQLVSGVLWLISAALATWVSTTYGIVALVFGGFLIFPLTQLITRIMGGNPTLSPQNSLRQLAMQVAFTLPLNLPLVAAAAMYRLHWFYPAFLIALGTHYLPFWHLYGMWQFAALGAVLFSAGFLLGMYGPETFALGGWIGGGVLIAFALVVWITQRGKS